MPHKRNVTRRELAASAVAAVIAAGLAGRGRAAAPSATSDRSASQAPGRQRKVLHIIGHSHIDAAWLWPWRDGESEVLNTFRSALDRMNEFPEFRFSHSSAAHYRWVEKADPRMLAEIESRIREGRWEVVGGWPVEPDCNIPAAESFARHCLYGKSYLRRSLGVEVSIGFNPDSFGHAAGLPTLLTQAGYGYYVFERPGDRENTLPHLFWWEGPDGSRVLTNRIWRYYDDDADGIPKMVGRAFSDDLTHATFFLGVGDHGGAVTKEQINKVVALRADPEMPELRFSTLGEFFAAIEKSAVASQLPVVRGELQHHARGCYSAYGEGKYQNRRAERALIQAEAISVVGAAALGHDYPRELYAESWWNVLFCQFHDMLAGTSQYSDYQDVRDSIGFACEAAQVNKVEVLESFARAVDTRGIAEGAVFAFNPLPWRRKALLQYVTDNNPSGRGAITHLCDRSGRSTDLQWRPPEHLSDGPPRLCALVDLPPLGYRVYELKHGPSAPGSGADRYQNNFVRPSEVGFGIASLRSSDGTELLSGPIGLVVLSDTSDTWAHGVTQFRSEIGRPQLQSAAVVENGPVIKVTRHRALWQTSEIILDIAQFAGLDVVELRFVINWHEREQILKLEVPTAFMAPKVFAKVPGAILERTPNGEEEPYQDWLALEGHIGRRGSTPPYTLALLNNSSYSCDCLNGLLRTVLIRSAPFARHDPLQVRHNDDTAWQDQGRQERRFWLHAGRGSYADLDLDRLAEELQTPAEYVADSAHAGNWPWESAFLEVTPGNIWVLAIKREEAGQGTVIRIQERAGRQTAAALRSGPWGFDHHIELAPWEIKTLLVHSLPGGAARLRAVSVLES